MLLRILLVLLFPALALAADCPFVVHNSYGKPGGVDRLAAAFASGLESVEADLTLGLVKWKVIVTHDRFVLGTEGEELGAFLERVWEHWKTPSPAKRVLVLDLKTGSGFIARKIHEALAPHAALLSKMTPGGEFQPGAITVLLSGSAHGMNEYESVAKDRGLFLAFGAYQYEKNDWKSDPASYAPRTPPGFRRYINIDRRALAGKSGGVKMDPARVKAMIAACTTAGYPTRMWIVNDPAEWKICVDAGVQMIATDDYKPAFDFWQALGH